MAKKKERSLAFDQLAGVVGLETAEAIFSGDPLVDEKVREIILKDKGVESVPVVQPWMAGKSLSEVEDFLRIDVEPSPLNPTERDADLLVGDERTAYVLGMTLEEARAKGYVKRKPVEISTRITWDQYGMQLATTAALRGDCRRRQVGAVLMAEDHSIISMGYNGGPAKGKSCLEGQCPRGLATKEEAPGNSAYDTGAGTCIALHAEWNVLLRTSWDQFEGSTLYVTKKPCHICSVMISGTRIRRVVAPGYDWASYL